VRLATRTGLAALAASSVSLLLIAAVVNRTLPTVLQDRVDQQLEDRSETAPILAAVAARLARSELSGTVEGARVLRVDELVELGQLPDDPLPPVDRTGFATASADGERWRLLTIRVDDVPAVGDTALVQLVSPLGDVDARAAELRRRAALIGLFTISLAGLIGYLLGRRASRPLDALREDADRWDDGDPTTWSVAHEYGSPEVDDVANALNASLSRLGEESERRNAALDAARAFAASATHELRTPLQSALTNVDIARSPLVDEAGRSDAVDQAHLQLQRLAGGLVAVRALADAEFAELSWFVPTDLAALTSNVVAEEAKRSGVRIEAVVPSEPVFVNLWADGARLAISNVIRNAIVHGHREEPAEIRVSLAGPNVVVDDRGPGVPAAERDRLIQRFERGSASGGSGLGLAIAHQVAVAHGGRLTIGETPEGGAQVSIAFGGSPIPAVVA
jgi:two-component system sensor histidine kinase PrrB